MDGLINFTGSISGEIEEGGGSGVTPHVTADASVNDQTGVPGVTVVRSGPDAAPHFDFEFVNLKGADGTPGAQGPQGLTGATGPAGAQGPRGFTGATGATGPAGADGYSPAVTITDITGGHRLTITDETHPLGQNFDIMNGIDGTDGQDGSPGPEGPEGPAGPGVAIGGTTGQFLKKAGSGDYLTDWGDVEASEVIYNNTDSGMAATDTQGAIDELNSNLAQLQNHEYGSAVDLSSYTSSYYTFPCDGFVICSCASSSNAKAIGRLYDSDSTSPYVPIGGWGNGTYASWSCFVKKGMRFQTITLESSGTITFIPLNG